MISRPKTEEKRIRRHKRVRAKVAGTADRPRMNVYRSANNIYVQLIDDAKGVTLCAASSLEKDVKGKGGNKEGAKLVGQKIAKIALKKGIETVVFDRGGYLYHGRVKELADGAREAGLKF